MKLHLPKGLFVAVMAACSVGYAFDGPQTGGDEPAAVTYASGSLNDQNAEAADVQLAPGADTVYDMTSQAKTTYEISAEGYHIKLSGNNSTNDKENYLNNTTAESLWMASGSFGIDADSDLTGVKTLYVCGGQAHITGNTTLSEDTKVVLGTSAVSTGFPSLNAGLRIGKYNVANVNVVFNGAVDVVEDTGIAFQNGGQLTLNGALTGSKAISLSVYDGANRLTIAGDASGYTGALSASGNVSVVLSGTGKTLMSSVGSVTLGQGSTLDLTGLTFKDGDSPTTDDNKSLVALMNKTTGAGTVKLAANTGIQTQGGQDDVLIRTNYVVGQDSSASLILNSWKKNSGWRTWQVGKGGSITVGSGDGSLNVRAGQRLEIVNGGIVSVGELKLGHEAAENPGSVIMSGADSKLTVNTILGNAAKSGGTFNNEVNITGGTLKVTGTNAVGLTATGGKMDVHIGGSAEGTVVLQTADNDWVLDGSKLGGGKAVIANVTIDQANAGTITFLNTTLAGQVVNNAGLLLGAGVTVEQGSTATVTGSKVTLASTLDCSGILNLNTDSVYLEPTLSGFVSTGGSNGYSLTGEGIDEGNTCNGFKMTSGANYYISENQNVTTAVQTVKLSDEKSYTLNSDESGLWFTVDAVRSSENYYDYYIGSGEVEVNKAIQALAENYVINGGTMKVTEGTITSSSISYTSGDVVVESEATIVLDNIEKLQSATSNGEHTNVFDGSMYAGTGALELQLHDNNGRGVNLSNFEGEIIVAKASGESKARLQVNSSTLHENATITLKSDNCELVFNSNDVTLANNLTVNGTSELHVNGSNNATINSTVAGNGTLIKKGNKSTLKLNGNITVGTFETNAGTTEVLGGSVSNLKVSGGKADVKGGLVTGLTSTGGTTNISGGATTLLSLSGGSVNVTGGSVTDIKYTGAGTVSFKLADGAESASYTVNEIITTTADNYQRHVNVASGVTLAIGAFMNQWGMGTLDVDGSMNATEITMTSGGEADNNNVITGDGSITTQTLNITNAGIYRFNVAQLNITSELNQDKATMNQHGGVINVNGQLNGTGGTMNLFAGQMNINNTDAENKIANLDMAGANNRQGLLTLAAGAALDVSTNFWLGGTSSVVLNEGASLTRDGMTVTGKGTDSKVTRLTDGTDNSFSHTSSSHEVKNASVSITKKNDNGNVLALKLTNSSVANNSESNLTVTNSGNSLTAVDAAKGNITLQNTSAQELSTLAIAAGKTVAVYTGTDTASVGTLTVSGTGSTASFGAGATLNSNLVLGTGAEVTLSDALTMGGSLTLSEGLTLNYGDAVTAVATLAEESNKVVLFTGVDKLYLGDNTEASGILTSADEVDISTYFTSDAFKSSEAGDYYLGYDGNNVYVDFVAKADDPGEDPSNPEGGDTNIPEPTTATLSLLALCGLAARRRRRA